MITRFDYVSEQYKVGGYPKSLPMRGTKHSAGYDFINPEAKFTMQPGEVKKIYSNVKVYLKEDQELQLRMRSSLGIQGLELLADTIDADYTDNIKTGGNIIITLRLREGFEPVTIDHKDRIVQGIISQYCVLDEDLCTGAERSGGHGSTGGK